MNITWPSRTRWAALWQTIGATKAPAGWYERLTNAYAEPQRRYHNQLHIAECLAEFDEARHLARQPHAVEIALWFHDAVYDSHAADNEEQSATLAGHCLAVSGIDEDFAETVSSLVMATKGHQVDSDPDAGLIVDVDLAILGREEKRFSEYERQISEEYSWVPKPVFAEKRSEILAHFLARRQIFATEWFRKKYEHRARRNLAASINKLRRISQ